MALTKVALPIETLRLQFFSIVDEETGVETFAVAFKADYIHKTGTIRTGAKIGRGDTKYDALISLLTLLSDDLG